MINFDKLTNYSQEILSSASALMNAKHNTQIEPEHIMLAMIQDNGISRDYLTELKLLNQDFINVITKAVSDFPTISGVQNTQQLFLSNNTSALLDIADTTSQELKDEYISIESILLAMTKLENSNIKKLLANANVNTKEDGEKLVEQLKQAEKAAEEALIRIFADRSPVPVSYKSNDALLCQLYRDNLITSDGVRQIRKDCRKITYSKEQSDKSVVLVTEQVDTDEFIELIKESTVHIIF